ncbi:MAG TPA: 2'-5' RNA ligase family protein [Bryobacteraceae bacterium]|nr:2'-5' RNA ligase family protein [Bryobacteraceae bacterium]
MDSSCGEGPSINSFALVTYVPEPLAGFIERFRQEAQPGCKARSHLTFLPPRPLDIPLEQIRKELEAGLRNQSPFRVELCEVQVFETSRVVHLSVGAGWEQAQRIHQILHQGHLECKECFDYHPHVTLAQDIDSAKLGAVAELATRRWKEYAGRRDFLVDHVTLVQNTVENRWTNLGEFALRVPVSV